MQGGGEIGEAQFASRQRKRRIWRESFDRTIGTQETNMWVIHCTGRWGHTCGAWQATRWSEGLKEKKEELELSIRDGSLAVLRKVCQANESRHVWKEASSGEDMEDKDSFGTLCYRTYRGHVFHAYYLPCCLVPSPKPQHSSSFLHHPLVYVQHAILQCFPKYTQFNITDASLSLSNKSSYLIASPHLLALKISVIGARLRRFALLWYHTERSCRV